MERYATTPVLEKVLRYKAPGHHVRGAGEQLRDQLIGLAPKEQSEVIG